MNVTDAPRAGETTLRAPGETDAPRAGEAVIR